MSTTSLWNRRISQWSDQESDLSIDTKPPKQSSLASLPPRVNEALRHPTSLGRVPLQEEISLVRQIANDPALRVELEALQVLEVQCRQIVAKLSSKTLKPNLKCRACALLLEITGFSGGNKVIHSTGTTDELCCLLRTGHGCEKKAAAAVLASLSADSVCRHILSLSASRMKPRPLLY